MVRLESQKQFQKVTGYHKLFACPGRDGRVECVGFTTDPLVVCTQGVSVWPQPRWFSECGPRRRAASLGSRSDLYSTFSVPSQAYGILSGRLSTMPSKV